MNVLTAASATFDGRSDPAWLEKVLGGLAHLGFAVVPGVLDDAAIAATREAMYRVQALIRDDIGVQRLRGAGEHGVLRNMVAYDPHFLGLPELLAVIDATVSPTVSCTSRTASCCHPSR